MFDLIIRNGQVVTPWGVGDWDVAIQGEKIVAVAANHTLTEESARVIDAAGKIVVPGRHRTPRPRLCSHHGPGRS